MARRVPIQLVILFLLLTLTLQGQLDPSNVLVSYSFDDQELATGPDTFAVFEKARGSVQMTTRSALAVTDHWRSATLLTTAIFRSFRATSNSDSAESSTSISRS